MRNEVIGKQLCIETLTPLDALHFAVVREGDQIFHQRISRGLPKMSVIRFNEGWQKSTNSEQTGYVKREPVNEIESQRGDKCDNCGYWLKFNHWKNCPARIIICYNCGGRGHFAEHCKEKGEKKFDATNKFTYFNTNEIRRFDLGHDKEEIAIRTMWDRAGKKNRKLLDIRMSKSQCNTETQIDCSGLVSFISVEK